jgi:hypothetical protein
VFHDHLCVLQLGLGRLPRSMSMWSKCVRYHLASYIYRISHNALLHGAGPSRSPDSLPWPAQWLGIQGHTRAYKGIQYNTDCTAPRVQSTPDHLSDKCQRIGTKMVYVQCPCACPFGDGDGMDSRSTSSGGSRRPKRSMPTKATYLHLQWQWRWNRGNSCSTISNVPMFQCSNVPMFQCSNVCQGDRGTHIRPFGHSASAAATNPSAASGRVQRV